MIGMMRRHVTGRARGDDGIALVVAIALIALVGMLIASMVAVAMYESRSTGRDRQRSQAVMAAEQSVDTLMSQIQSTALTAVPCGPQTSSVSVVSDRLALTGDVTYYDQGGTAVACTAVRAGTTRVYQASITATATSEALMNQAPAARTVEMLVNLHPEFANDLTKAIFGDAGVNLDNAADIYGENGAPNADLYANGDVTCNNNQHFYGSIYAQGTVSMSNRCVVEVDVAARNGFNATNPQVAVNGRITVSNGNISLTKAQVGQQALASGTVTGDICSTPNKCFPGTAVAAPPAQAFPILNWDAATQSEWAANGYTNVITFSGSSCTGSIPNPYNGKADWVGYQLYLMAPHLTQNTIVVSTCPQKVMFQGLDLDLSANLAIFSTPGFVFSNNTGISSTDSTTRNLYLIQPYNAVSTHPCTADGISLDNQVTVDPTIEMLMYSPCSIRKANNTTHYGQIYSGGQVNINNKLTMYYHPLPVFGIASSTVIEAYAVEIQYKRENL